MVCTLIYFSLQKRWMVLNVGKRLGLELHKTLRISKRLGVTVTGGNAAETCLTV